MRHQHILVGIVCLLFAAACAPATVVPPAKQAGVYFEEGENFFEKGLYQDAIASWEKVRDSYYSPELNILAELKIAEAHFLAQQYIEAAAAYEAFLKAHPEHQRVPDALMQLGLSYINQMGSIDQDQTATRQALRAFETLKERFPKDRRKEEVQIYIDRCLNHLAGHEVEIGRFYLNKKEYKAAIRRFEGVFKKYPNYYDRDAAYYYLGQAYLLSGDKVRASEAFNSLYNGYPHSAYLLDAQKFIDKNY
jgi:outer membrane protein assembly factor BamD